MNARGHVQLSVALSAFCVAVGAVNFAQRLGWGETIHWSTPITPAPLRSVQRRVVNAPRLAEMDQYAEAWRHPLWNADRQPEPKLQPAAPIKPRPALETLVELTGVMLAPELRAALLRQASGDATYIVREGNSLPQSTWVLEKLNPRSAIFIDDRREHAEIKLKVAVANVQQPFASASAADGGMQIRWADASTVTPGTTAGPMQVGRAQSGSKALERPAAGGDL